MFSKYTEEQRMTVVAALRAHVETPFISHQWEELVLSLQDDEDPKIRERVKRELKDILEKDPGFKSYMALVHENSVA
jgi:hypothetical protein